MEFCPACGCILLNEEKKNECIRCGYKLKTTTKLESSEKIQSKTEIGVIDEKETEVTPVTSAICPKCGHKEAYFWSLQTRAGDEAETRFFKCTKCKHTWKEYR